LCLQVGQPFDIIKTRLQVLAKGSVGAIGMPESIVYSNSMDCVRKMVRRGTVNQLIVAERISATLAASVV
jgi:hypothetical protein